MGIVSSKNPKDVAAANKVPLWLVPPCGQIAVAKVLKHGADKYGPWNWRGESINASNYISAIQRHTLAFLSGEDVDPESGLPHLAHIAATAHILMDATEHGRVNDDRPTCK